MLSQADRIAFSLNIISAPKTIAAVTAAKGQIQQQLTTLLNLDSANANLFAPVNSLIAAYQSEYSALDGNGRTQITEQDIQDSAAKKIGNHFFPNVTTATVPSLAASNNIWTKANPYALTYAIGKNGSEAYSTVTGENPLITQILGLISSASSYQDIENTTGQNATQGNAAATPPTTDSVQAYPAVQTLKSNLVSAINTYVNLLTSESSSIVTNDPNASNQANNNAAKAAIPTIQNALNSWLAYPDFNPLPTTTTYTAFYAYNSNTLAPTKLHSTQLAALQSAIQSRQTFVTTRLSQLSTLLGTITQDLNSGVATGTGLYGKRYGFLNLRLNSLGGSLSQYLGLKGTTSAQDSIIGNIQATSNTYLSVLATSALAAPASGTPIVNVVNGSLFSPGDTVFIYAEGQQELQRSIKSVNGNSITLNDIVPSKYLPSSGARIYKDLS